MTSREAADLVLSWSARSDIEQLLPTIAERLSLETIAILKERVDDEKLRNARRALEVADATVRAATFVSGPEADALAQWARGNALYHLSRYGEALACYRRAQSAYETLGRPLDVARLQINQVAALRDMSQFGAAIALAEQARATCAAVGDTARRFLGLLEMNVGAAYRQRGDLDAAMVAYDRGRAIFEQLGERVEAARIDMNRANVLQEMDRFVAAERLLTNARAALAETGRDQEVARADLYLGTLAYRRGEYQVALKYHEAALSGFAAIPNFGEVAMVNLHRSLVYRDLNLLHETITVAGAAEQRFKQDSAHWLRMLALMNQATGYRRLGAHATAEKLLVTARALLRRQGARGRVPLLDLERAAVALEEGRHRTARRLARRVERDIDPAIWPAVAARLHLLLARVALAEPGADLGAAAQHARAAHALAQRYALPDVGATLHVLARVAEGEGDPETAWRQCRAAVAEVEQARARLPLDELHMGFTEDKLPIYADAVRLSLRVTAPPETLQVLNLLHTAPLPRLADAPRRTAPNRAGDEELRTRLRELREAWHWYQGKLDRPAELASGAEAPRPESEAVALRQRLRKLEDEIAELSRRWQVRATTIPIDARSERAVPGEAVAEAFVDAIQRRITPDAALLHYFVCEDAIGVALITAAGVKLQPRLAPVAPLERLLKSWRFHLEHGVAALASAGRSMDARLRRLHEALFAPLAPALRAYDQLYLVLPPGWHDLPFAALADGEQYLAEQFRLTHHSAPEVLLHTHAERPSLSRPHALIAGYSDGGRLPLAVAEAEQIAGVLAPHFQTTCLTEAGATVAELGAALPDADLLHLATHAMFRPDNPLFSWALLADARLTVADLYEMTLPRRPLVVLSACETGRGQPRGGGLLGMGRGFLAAGASGLVVSLWKVADSASARLMADFYHARCAAPTGQHERDAAALQNAQRAAIARGEDPFGWAGFIYIGG